LEKFGDFSPKKTLIDTEISKVYTYYYLRSHEVLQYQYYETDGWPDGWTNGWRDRWMKWCFPSRCPLIYVIYTKIEPYVLVQHWSVCSSIAVSIIIPYSKVAPYIPVQHWCILSSGGLQAILHSIISHDSWFCHFLLTYPYSWFE